MLPCSAATMLEHHHQVPLSGMWIFFSISNHQQGFFLFSLRLKALFPTPRLANPCLTASSLPVPTYGETIPCQVTIVTWTDWRQTDEREKRVMGSLPVRYEMTQMYESWSRFFFLRINCAALCVGSVVGAIASRKGPSFTLRSRLLCAWKVSLPPTACMWD